MTCPFGGPCHDSDRSFPALIIANPISNAVGDTVTPASRLQGLNKELGPEVAVSGSKGSRMESAMALKDLPPQRVKGKSQPVGVYTFVS